MFRTAIAAFAVATAAVMSSATPAQAGPVLDRMPACNLEDGSGQRVCVWVGEEFGNGHGVSFVARNRPDGSTDIRYIHLWRAKRLVASMPRDPRPAKFDRCEPGVLPETACVNLGTPNERDLNRSYVMRVRDNGNVDVNYISNDRAKRLLGL